MLLVFTTENCAQCAAFTQNMERRGVEFVEVREGVPVEDAEAQEMRAGAFIRCLDAGLQTYPMIAECESGRVLRVGLMCPLCRGSLVMGREAEPCDCGGGMELEECDHG